MRLIWKSGIVLTLSASILGCLALPHAADQAAVSACTTEMSGLVRAGAPAEIRRLSPAILCLDGAIGADTVEPLASWAAEPSDVFKRLVVRSHGGDAAAGIEIAEALQGAGAAVHVVDICASSCANYLYAGLPNRHISGASLVLFHGGFSDQTEERALTALDRLLADMGDIIPDKDAERDRIRADFGDKRQRQDSLLARAGASTAIIHGVDAIDKADLPEELCGDAERPRDFVFLSPEQAERLGIAPLTGTLPSTPAEVNARLYDVVEDAGFTVCRAPDSLIDSAL